MKVTVAICTWNRCQLLAKTCEQMCNLHVPKDVHLDILVINNNCTDETDAVVDAFVGRLPIRRVPEPKPGLSNARNAAFVAAPDADFLIFTDDDVLVQVDWLEQFRAATEAYPDAAVYGGAIDPWFPEPPDPDLLACFDSLRNGFCGLDHGEHARILGDDQYVWGANMAYRVAAVGALRFDPAWGPSPTTTIGGDEVDYQTRIKRGGQSVVWWPRMRVAHHVDPSRMTLDYLFTYTRDKGTQKALMLGGAPGRRLMGAPVWVLRLALTARVRRLLARLNADPPGGVLTGGSDVGSPPHRRVLMWSREIAYIDGLLRGYRRASQKPEPTSST